MSDTPKEFIEAFVTLYNQEPESFKLAKDDPEMINFLIGRYMIATNRKFKEKYVRQTILGMIA